MPQVYIQNHTQEKAFHGSKLSEEDLKVHVTVNLLRILWFFSKILWLLVRQVYWKKKTVTNYIGTVISMSPDFK